MAHYYLHLHENGSVLEDPDGRDFVSLDAAINLAVLSARDVMAGDLLTGKLCLSHSISIVNIAHTEVARVKFRDAVVLTE
ncbi:DUF6894 family protein [Sphingobium sp. RSMS]|uniref:DUF6894 family protein n=1 Tax=Sphingobium sp. RSMS TaxID=520734 RepID=UPI003977D0E3